MGSFVLAAVVLGVCILFYQIFLQWRIAPAVLSKWAQENEFRVEMRRRTLFFGPYAWRCGAIPECLLDHCMGPALVPARGLDHSRKNLAAVPVGQGSPVIVHWDT